MHPTAITADRASAILTVTWDDGSASALPFAQLSDMCPCELCDNERRNNDPLKILRPHSHELEAINPVGSYAINVMWRGGCHYGIYSWEYLNRLGRMDAPQTGSPPPTEIPSPSR